MVLSKNKFVQIQQGIRFKRQKQAVKNTFFFTFQSVDNFDQTPGYEFENNDFYEKDSFQHINPTQESLRRASGVSVSL